MTAALVAHEAAEETTQPADQAIGLRILALEAQLERLLRRWPESVARLDAPEARHGRTRHGKVDRLEQALQVATHAHRDDPCVSRANALWSDAQALRWSLALSMLPLARQQARRFAARRNLAAEDLTQEGVLGLLAAARRYEPGRNVRFSVYARWWLRARLTQAVDVGRVVRLSSAAQELLRNVRKQIRFCEVTGATWTVTDLAQTMGLNPERVRRVLVAAEFEAIEGREDRDPGEIVAQLPDDIAPDPEQHAAQSEEHDRLRVALQTSLAPRERIIMELRYGIGRAPHSVAAIAQRLSLSAERVRQLEHRSLAVLRGSGLRPS